jgi:hypothetical protein
MEDSPLKVGFADNHFVRTPGGGGTAEVVGEAIYLTLSVRNAGNGIAVLHGWRFEPGTGVLNGEELRRLGTAGRPSLDDFQRLTRDIYIAAGDVGFWQGALRDRRAPEWDVLARCIEEGERFLVDLLYGDHQGGQRVISRFSFLSRADAGWLAAVSRHWNVDRPDPR